MGERLCKSLDELRHWMRVRIEDRGKSYHGEWKILEGGTLGPVIADGRRHPVLLSAAFDAADAIYILDDAPAVEPDRNTVEPGDRFVEPGDRFECLDYPGHVTVGLREGNVCSIQYSMNGFTTWKSVYDLENPSLYRKLPREEKPAAPPPPPESQPWGWLAHDFSNPYLVWRKGNRACTRCAVGEALPTRECYPDALKPHATVQAFLEAQLRKQELMSPAVWAPSPRPIRYAPPEPMRSGLGGIVGGRWRR